MCVCGGVTEKFKNEGFLSFQEQGNEKTNNGTHYKLQLLYSNGKWLRGQALSHQAAKSGAAMAIPYYAWEVEG